MHDRQLQCWASGSAWICGHDVGDANNAGVKELCWTWTPHRFNRFPKIGDGEQGLEITNLDT